MVSIFMVLFLLFSPGINQPVPPLFGMPGSSAPPVQPAVPTIGVRPQTAGPGLPPSLPIIDSKGDMWLEHKTPEGRSYYGNVRTRETSWQRPEGREMPAGPGGLPPMSVPGVMPRPGLGAPMPLMLPGVGAPPVAIANGIPPLMGGPPGMQPGFPTQPPGQVDDAGKPMPEIAGNTAPVPMNPSTLTPQPAAGGIGGPLPPGENKSVVYILFLLPLKVHWFCFIVVKFASFPDYQLSLVSCGLFISGPGPFLNRPPMPFGPGGPMLQNQPPPFAPVGLPAPPTTGLTQTKVWSEHKHPDGRTYYFNRLSMQSVWERPTDFDVTMAPVLLPPGVPPAAAAAAATSMAAAAAAVTAENKQQDENKKEDQ